MAGVLVQNVASFTKTHSFYSLCVNAAETLAKPSLTKMKINETSYKKTSMTSQNNKLGDIRKWVLIYNIKVFTSVEWLLGMICGFLHGTAWWRQNR